MGKASKIKVSKSNRTTPLHEQITDDEAVRPTGRVKTNKRDALEEGSISGKLSRSILEQARLQQLEDLKSANTSEADYKNTASRNSLDKNDSGDEDEESGGEGEEDFIVEEIGAEDESTGKVHDEKRGEPENTC